MDRVVKAIIFDMDGTLLNTINDIADSMNYVLKEHNFPTHEIDSYYKFVGNGIDTLVSRVLPQDHKDEKTKSILLSELSKRYARHWADKTTVYKGIPELLDFLKESSLKTSILTNKPHNFALEMADHFLSKWDFNAILGANDNMPKKPDSYMALELCKRLKVDPEECILLGDSDVDMLTAKAANIRAVGAAWGFRDAVELLRAGANFVIANPLDLIKLL